MDQITPPKPETPFIFTEEGKNQAFKAIDKAVKYGKLFFLLWVCGGLGLAGLILWVIVHFIRKHW